MTDVDTTAQYRFPGLSVRMGEPRTVAESRGFVWYPRIVQLEAGPILVSHSAGADTTDLNFFSSVVLRSTDGGKTFPTCVDVTAWPSIWLQTGSRNMGGPTSHAYRDPIGTPGEYRHHYVRVKDDGSGFSYEPWGAVTRGLPRPAQLRPTAPPRGRFQQAEIRFHGDVVDIDGGHLTVAYLRLEGDEKLSIAAFVSPDGGRTWNYRSEVAGQNTDLLAREGPNESCVTRLENGDLLCIFRASSDRNLLKSLSSDEGKTWSSAERLPASAVDPTLLRLQNGTLVLVTGRPGIDIWLSIDGRGDSWERIDLTAYHNSFFDDPTFNIVPVRVYDRETRHGADQTTGYSSAIEITPNRVLLVYDRIAFGWKPVPIDSPERSRIHILEVDVYRT